MKTTYTRKPQPFDVWTFDGTREMAEAIVRKLSTGSFRPQFWISGDDIGFNIAGVYLEKGTLFSIAPYNKNEYMLPSEGRLLDIRSFSTENNDIERSYDATQFPDAKFE